MALIRLLRGIGSQQSTTEQPCYSPGRLLIVHRNVSFRYCYSECSGAGHQGHISRSWVTCHCGNNQNWNSIFEIKRPRAQPHMLMDCCVSIHSFTSLHRFSVGKAVDSDCLCVYSLTLLKLIFFKNFLHKKRKNSFFLSCHVSQQWLSSPLSCHNCPVDPIKSHLLSKHDGEEKKNLLIQYSISG